jgi:hypothetical protein
VHDCRTTCVFARQALAIYAIEPAHTSGNGHMR